MTRPLMPRAQHYAPTEGVRTGWRSAAMDGPRAHGRPFFCSERAAGVQPGYYRFAEKGAESPVGPFLTSQACRVALGPANGSGGPESGLGVDPDGQGRLL